MHRNFSRKFREFRILTCTKAKPRQGELGWLVANLWLRSVSPFAWPYACFSSMCMWSRHSNITYLQNIHLYAELDLLMNCAFPTKMCAEVVYQLSQNPISPTTKLLARTLTTILRLRNTGKWRSDKFRQNPDLSPRVNYLFYFQQYNNCHTISPSRSHDQFNIHIY